MNIAETLPTWAALPVAFLLVLGGLISLVGALGLLRLANETGIPREALAERLVMRIKSLEAKKLEGKRSA